MSKIFSILFAGLSIVGLSSLTLADEDIPAKQLEFFEKKIRPVLVNECYSCHSKESKSVKGGLVVDTREGIRAGGDSGHGVVPGDLDSSLILEAIKYESVEMPPKEQLPESVIKDFERWIKMGAPDPRKGPSLIKREINFKEAKKHWAFQPIKDVEPPTTKNRKWSYSDIDQFVLAELEKNNLAPVDAAEKLTLIRRLYFDLIGLPPTPEQLEEALADDSVDAIEKLVDSLLASPQFGEKWARHWLDVSRYAESNGRERNFVYPNAWRYRDYVIDAFNDDKPFDQFIREQISGDLMNQAEPDVEPLIRNERLIATGFLAIGPKLLNEGNKNEFLMDMVDEQVDVTTRAFMGLTVSCARCHDHKFDPIPTSEYYSMAGIFRSTQTLYGTKRGGGNRQASALAPLAALGDDQAAKLQRTKDQIAALEKKLAIQKKAQQNFQKKLKAAQKKKNQAEIKKFKDSVAFSRKNIQKSTKDLKQLKDSGAIEQAMGVRDGKVADSPIYIRGEVSSPKGTAKRGLLTILDPHLEQPVLETAASGRTELADWIVDEQNTLTRRVIVNRVWNQLFSEGLVRTVDNFGATGESPSHPELLDYLAVRFSDNGWSVKRLIRDLVLSRTYQLSSSHCEGNYSQDPGNVLLWRHSPKRIEAEALRDSMMMAGGTLNLEPAEASPVATLDGEYGRQVRIAEMTKGNIHRSIYLPIVRNAVPDALKLFDFAEPSILVGDRPVTTVPTQALFFLNSKFVTQQCDQLAEQLLTNESLDDSGRVDLAYRTVLSRPASKDEVERAKGFIEATSARLAEGKAETSETRKTAWSGFCQALFGAAEFRYVD